MLRTHLSTEQRAELEGLRRHAVGRVAGRAHMVLLNDQGYHVPEIAQIAGCGRDVVRHWLHGYQQWGIAGLYDDPRTGRPRTHPWADLVVDTQASQSPPCSGHVQTCWSVGLIGAFLGRRFGIRLSGASLRRALHRQGWRWARPRLAPVRCVDPEAEGKVATLAAAWAQVQVGEGQLLFVDESDLHLLPVVRAMWMKGPRRRIPTPGTNRRHAFFGALDARRGTWISTDHEHKRAAHFLALLQRLLTLYPSGPLYVALDNAPIHTARLIQHWLADQPRVTALWLPKYAGHEHNPVERIWGLMKAAVAANRPAGSMDALIQVARDFLAVLRPYPVKYLLAS
jgi:transposase